MKLSANGIKLIARFEGCVLKVYNDVANNATIGYGHLLHHGPFLATDPQTITQAEADELLIKDAAIHEAAVNKAVKVPLTQNQFDALVSLSFNIGTGGLSTSSLVKAINAGKSNDAEEMRKLFGLWNKKTVTIKGKPTKVVDKGLDGRRKSEATVFLKKDDAPAPG